MSIFETLNGINVNDKTEKKNGLTYLSWAWAWGEVKKAFPNATFTIYERETEYGPVNYFTDGRTCWVKTGLTIDGLEHVEELPVMDFRNAAIPLEKVTSTDVNKTIQRSLTKAAARHGLGLYIYAGEDLPESEQEPPKEAGPAFTRPDVNASAVTKVETIPAKEVTPVAQFLLKQMGALREARGITPSENNKLFKAQHKALVGAKLAPDKPLDKYTMQEAEALVDAMSKCFELTGTELKTK